MQYIKNFIKARYLLLCILTLSINNSTCMEAIRQSSEKLIIFDNHRETDILYTDSTNTFKEIKNFLNWKNVFYIDNTIYCNSQGSSNHRPIINPIKDYFPPTLKDDHGDILHWNNAEPMAFDIKKTANKLVENVSIAALLCIYYNNIYCIISHNKSTVNVINLDIPFDSDFNIKQKISASYYDCHIFTNANEPIIYNLIVQQYQKSSDIAYIYTILLGNKKSSNKFILNKDFIINNFLPHATLNQLIIEYRSLTKDLNTGLACKKDIKIDDTLIEKDVSQNNILIHFLLRVILAECIPPVYCVLTYENSLVNETKNHIWNLKYLIIRDTSNNFYNEKVYFKKPYIHEQSDGINICIIRSNNRKRIDWTETSNLLPDKKSISKYMVAEKEKIDNYWSNNHENFLSIDSLVENIPYYNIIKINQTTENNPITIESAENKVDASAYQKNQPTGLYFTQADLEEINNICNTIKTMHKTLDELQKSKALLTEQQFSDQQKLAKELENIHQKTQEFIDDVQYQLNILSKQHAYSVRSYQEAYQQCLDYSQELINKLPGYIHYLNFIIQQIICAGKLAQMDLTNLKRYKEKLEIEYKSITEEYAKVMSEMNILRNEIKTIETQELVNIKAKFQKTLDEEIQKKQHEYNEKYEQCIAGYERQLKEKQEIFEGNIDSLNKQLKASHKEIETLKNSIAEMETKQTQEWNKLNDQTNTFQQKLAQEHAQQIAALEKKYQDLLQNVQIKATESLQKILADEQEKCKLQEATLNKAYEEALNKLKEQYENQITTLQANCKQQNEQIMAAAKTELKTLQTQIQESQTGYNKALDLTHAYFTEKLSTNLSNLEKLHTDAITNLKKNHIEEMTRLTNNHVNEMARLKKNIYMAMFGIILGVIVSIEVLKHIFNSKRLQILNRVFLHSL